MNPDQSQPNLVRITDVSPRDGLQNEPALIATADKCRLIELLAATGVDEIEATSFVSPKWVPQLGDAAELLAMVAALPAFAPGANGPMLSALVPNEKGLQGLLSANQAAGQAANQAAGRTLVKKASVFTAASERFSQENTNATIAQTIERFKPVIREAHAVKLLVRGYVSCIIACPFEGPVAPAQVADVCLALLDLGVDELDLGDTIGAATPETTRALFEHLYHKAHLDPAQTNVPITLHLHDTFARAAECVKVALDLGVRSFDSSAAGLGGCPYASTRNADGTTKRAPGNIATETLVRAVHSAGYTTNVDLAALSRAGDFARTLTNRPHP
jgi:hydroxymethylglutaryl-CoA lyase